MSIVVELLPAVAAAGVGFAISATGAWCAKRRTDVDSDEPATPGDARALQDRDFALFSECPDCAVPGFHLLNETHERVHPLGVGPDHVWRSRPRPARHETVSTRMKRECLACAATWDETLSTTKRVSSEWEEWKERQRDEEERFVQRRSAKEASQLDGLTSRAAELGYSNYEIERLERAHKHELRAWGDAAPKRYVHDSKRVRPVGMSVLIDDVIGLKLMPSSPSLSRIDTICERRDPSLLRLSRFFVMTGVPAASPVAVSYVPSSARTLALVTVSASATQLTEGDILDVSNRTTSEGIDARMRRAMFGGDE